MCAHMMCYWGSAWGEHWPSTTLCGFASRCAVLCCAVLCRRSRACCGRGWRDLCLAVLCVLGEWFWAALAVVVVVYAAVAVYMLA
jgi:hypothetical protein